MATQVSPIVNRRITFPQDSRPIVQLLLLHSMILGVVFGIRMYTNPPIPSWAPYASGLLLVLLIQIASTSFAGGVETLFSEAEAEARWMVTT